MAETATTTGYQTDTRTPGAGLVGLTFLLFFALVAVLALVWTGAFSDLVTQMGPGLMSYLDVLGLLAAIVGILAIVLFFGLITARRAVRRVEANARTQSEIAERRRADMEQQAEARLSDLERRIRLENDQRMGQMRASIKQQLDALHAQEDVEDITARQVAFAASLRREIDAEEARLTRLAQILHEEQRALHEARIANGESLRPSQPMH